MGSGKKTKSVSNYFFQQSVPLRTLSNRDIPNLTQLTVEKIKICHANHFLFWKKYSSIKSDTIFHSTLLLMCEIFVGIISLCYGERKWKRVEMNWKTHEIEWRHYRKICHENPKLSQHSSGGVNTRKQFQKCTNIVRSEKKGGKSFDKYADYILGSL